MAKELLFSLTKKDFEMQVFRSGGAGGQNQNKVSSGVRFIHKVSGAVGEARDSRDQITNKKHAFERLYSSKKFQAWLKLEIARRNGLEETVRRKVAEMMQPQNLKIEYFDVEEENG